jgi:SWI/SNF-related matrix-associated actin-dependent regulator 1 of chromatin subfamily A
MKSCTIVDNKYQVKFSGSDFRETLNGIKALPNRVYLPDRKIWETPITEVHSQALTNLGFQLPIIASTTEKDSALWENIQVSEVPGLRPYQVEAQKFLTYRKGRGLILDDQGVGKTIESLAYLRINPEKRPAVIVVKSSLKKQWVRKAEEWLPGEESIILSGRTPYSIPEEIPLIIVNWEILTYWEHVLRDINPAVVIGDEVQMMGNWKAKRTKAAISLVNKTRADWIGLSGTPIRSRPLQFFPSLHLTSPARFPNFYAYRQRYCDPRHNGFGWTYNGLTHGEELQAKIRDLYIRRTKNEVLPDLPPKIRDMIPIDLTDSEAYEMEKQNYLSDILATRKETDEALRSLSRTAFDLKKEAAVNWIREFVAEGEKLVVYYYHRAVRCYLEEQFGKEALFIDGSVSAEKKDEIKQRFIEDPESKILFGNIQSLGTGTDGIQEVCSTCAFIEFAFTPIDMVQAEDRLHRDGQRDSVNVYYLTGVGTIDEDYINLLHQKAGILNDLFGEDMVDRIEGMKELLRYYREVV